LESKEVSTETFDAVIVASGHYDDPFVPDIAGLEAWNSTLPGSISHSKFYRQPEVFTGKVCLSNHTFVETH